MASMRMPARDLDSISQSEQMDSIEELLFGTELVPDESRSISVDHEGRQVHIYLKSTSESAACPWCGTVSDRFHCSNFRHPQWMPVNGMTTYAHIELKRFRCLNPECRKITFAEELESVKANQQRSDLVNLVVFAVSVFCSDVATSMICREMGIDISEQAA